MKERTNTSREGGFTPIEEGIYHFTVLSKPDKFRTASGKSTYRKWKFVTDVNGKRREVHIVLFPWESEDLLLFLGGKKIGNEVEWDPDEVEGVKFKALLQHKSYQGNDGKDKLKYVLSDFENEIPF